MDIGFQRKDREKTEFQTSQRTKYVQEDLQKLEMSSQRKINF
jgi:hypothetical protein